MSSAIESVPSAESKQVIVLDKLLCNLIVLRNSDSEVLLLQEGASHRLPLVEIPRGERAAPHLIAKSRSNWNTGAVCRFRLTPEDVEEERPYFVLDALGPDSSEIEGAAWVAVDKIDWADSEPITIRDRFKVALAQCEAYNTGLLAGRFVRSRWFGDLAVWVEEELNNHGLRLGQEWEQYNMGPDFSLVRFETNELPVWFKAVGEPNLREFGISKALAVLDSASLPTILATHAGWNGWLTLDANGHHLDEIWEVEYWQRSARSFAEIQLESLPYCREFIDAGCEDLRIGKLLSLARPFLDVVSQLMEIQPPGVAQLLNTGDLKYIENQLIYACQELDRLGIPDALGHTDLNPGNILVNRSHAVFIDWMQGNISHPFLTLEYLIALLVRLRPDLASWSSSIRDTYRQSWTGVCQDFQFSRAFELTPLVAVFTFAVALPGWKEDVHGMSPGLAKLIRSLARRMLYEARALGMSSRE